MRRLEKSENLYNAAFDRLHPRLYAHATYSVNAHVWNGIAARVFGAIDPDDILLNVLDAQTRKDWERAWR